MNLRIIQAGFLLVLAGCSASQLVPSDMEGRISRDVSFQSLQTEPATFRGRWVALGGKVPNAKRLKHETQIEILELPLDKADRPIPMLTQSSGRFLAVQQEFLDPAIVPPGTFVSLVGEVIGGDTLLLDEINYTYPVVQNKTLKVWQDPGRMDYLEPQLIRRQPDLPPVLSRLPPVRGIDLNRNQIPRLSKADALGTLIEKLLDPSINLSPNPVHNGDGSVNVSDVWAAFRKKNASPKDAGRGPPPERVGFVGGFSCAFVRMAWKLIWASAPGPTTGNTSAAAAATKSDFRMTPPRRSRCT